jgi:hypothetical protein
MRKATLVVVYHTLSGVAFGLQHPMPPKKKKQWPTPPFDPELRAQVMAMIEAYSAGRLEFVYNFPVDQALSRKTGEALMRAMGDFVKAYENNEFSPTMQKKIITTLKKTVRRFTSN